MIVPGKVPIRRTLGQTDEEWRARAQKAIQDYDALVSELSSVPDDTARGEILKWIGRSDLPGAPAERYESLKMDLHRGPMNPQKVGQLEEIVKEFGFKLSTSGLLPAPSGAGSRTEVGVMTWCILGGIGLLSLVILPLLSD